MRKAAQESVVAILLQQSIFQSSRHIACYQAFRDEFATEAIINAIWQAGKICYLPVLTDTKVLHFIRYERDDELQLNQFSIPEPVNMQHAVQAEKLDLVMMPLIAFDAHGNRIGTGGGYYDRTFAFLFNKPQRGPFMMGVGFQVQECPEIQSEPWDIKMNGVLTETGLTIF